MHLGLTPLQDGRQERVQFDKITARVSRLCYGLDMDHVDPVAITQKVISGVYGGVTTIQLDDLVSISFHIITSSHRFLTFLAGCRDCSIHDRHSP